MCEFVRGLWKSIKNNKVNTFILLLLFILLVLSFLCDFRVFIESNNHFLLLKNNTLYAINVISKIVPLIVFLLLVYLWRKIASKMTIKLERINVGGVSVVFEKPDEYFKQQIKNFLNTKRSLFRFDSEKDNIYDCINSCYEIYKYIRESINVYDARSSKNSAYYDTANEMLRSLNEFLTCYQSNFRRWYEFSLENTYKTNVTKSLIDIQKECWGYASILEAFAHLNNAFQEYAETFEINTGKWSINNSID